MYVFQCYSLNSPRAEFVLGALSPAPAVPVSLFSMSESLLLPCEQIPQYHFSRFHIYALIYDICFSSF